MEIRVLGPVEVGVDGELVALGGPKQRALFALLVAAVPDLVSTDGLIDGLWGEEVSPGSRSTLQTYVSNLRQVLGAVLVHERGGYRLVVDPAVIDAVEFTRALEDARVGLATDSEKVAVGLRRVLALWRGRPYADLVDVPGLESETRRLEALRLEAVELRIDAELACGRHSEVLAELEALAEGHPTREHFRAQHMLALYRAGRQADALRAYRRSEAYLAETLGVDPSEELQDLELRILGHDEALRFGGSRAVTQRLAFLVSEIEGSSRLWDRFPQAMAAAVADYDRILGEGVEEAGGRVVKHTGERAVAVFPDAMAAVAAAEAMLSRLAGTDWGEIGELRVRLGVDVGEAEARGDDFYGPPLTRASRLCAIGHGGQVLLSSAAERNLTASAPPGLQVRHLGEVPLRGMAAPERVSQLVFSGLPADFPDLRLDAASGLDHGAEAMSLPGYEVREPIGEGTFGVVWRAYQPSVGREVAIKIVRSEFASRPSFIRRFEAEARTVARLAHPHIVPLIDFWRDATGAYLVLQLLEGGSLRETLAAGSLDVAARRRILHQVGAALDHAHAQGVIHGDFQPDNILLDETGNAYLSDFGIAARLVDFEVAVSMSSAPAFRAPEEPRSGPTKAADLFAFGMLARHLLGDHPELEELLARATSPHPGDRYPSASAILADLDEALGQQAPVVEPPAVSRNPYKGLRAFDESDAPDFHGRDELVAALTDALSRHRFVTVVGPSGSGKSSAVRAGLLPALADGAVEGSERWFRTVLTPGTHPLESLLEALEALAPRPAELLGPLENGDLTEATDRLLGDADGELVIVVDQFEEVFSLVDDPRSRDAFLDLLVQGVQAQGSRVRVVATLRADFYDRPLEYEGLDRLVRDGLVTVLRPSPEELLEMISRPAQAVGLRWEPGLPHRIAQEVVDQPGGLPLLQYALTELVERRRADLLTDDDYQRTGGVAGALTTRAETIFGELAPSRQEAARQVLLRLVTVDEDAEATRRRVRRSELESLGIDGEDLEPVLEAFTSERLLLADRDTVTRGPTIEVAHEALLREWPRLRAWIEDQREALILGRRLRAAIDEWEAAGRNDDYLLAGFRLAPFSTWAESASLSSEERAFLQACQERDQAEQEARARRRRVLTRVLATATLVAVVLASVAFAQSRRATQEADRAVAAERQAEANAVQAAREADRANREAATARARELAASAINTLDEDPSLAKLLALSAASTGDPPLEVISVLHRAYAGDPVVARYTWPEDGNPWTDLHPSGRRLVASGGEADVFAEPARYLEVADLETGLVLWSFDPGDDSVAIGPSFFSKDAERVVAATFWIPEGEDAGGPPADLLGAHIWDAETGELTERIDLGRCGGWAADLSETHLMVRTLLTDSCRAEPGSQLSTIDLVDLGTGERTTLATITRMYEGGFWGADLSGDGRRAAIIEWAGDEAASVVIDLETGERLLEYQLDPEAVLRGWGARKLNYDGSLLISGDRPIEVWDVDQGEVVARFDGHPGESIFGEFAPTGSTVYSTGRDGTLRHWDASTGRELDVFPALGFGRPSVTEGGYLLVTNTETRTASLLYTRTRGEIGAIETCRGFVYAHSLNVSGGLGAFHQSCEDRFPDVSTHIVDLESLEIIHSLSAQGGQALRISPDGAQLVRQEGAGTLQGPLRIRNLRTGRQVVELEGMCTFDSGSPLEPDQQPPCRTFPEQPFPIWAWQLRWSPDGSMVAVAEQISGGVAVWETETGELIFTAEPTDRESFGDLIFTPDSQGLVLSETSGKLHVLSTESWEFLEVRLGNPSLHLVGYSPDGSILIGGRFFGGSDGALHWLDGETLKVIRSRERAHDASIKSSALSPDGSLIATGASDGFVRVWDIETGELVHEIPIGDTQVQGVAFVNDRHLAVTPQEGNLLIFTIDTDELLEIVRISLTRGFTETECQRYNFGDACPTLEELQRG